MTYGSGYAQSWALVIGVNQYQKAAPLRHAVNDAIELGDILRDRFGFAEETTTLLLDDEATGGAIRRRFMEFRSTSPDDRLVVFFAGHGHTTTGKRGEVGFLVPCDGDIGDLSTLVRWDELTRGADLIPAKHIFFVMDACYGGLALVRTPAFGAMRFMGDMLQRYARQVLTAGKADEVVADGDGVRPGHSMFTAHLLDALEGKAATESGILTASGVMAYVYDRVARDQYSHQTPHYGFLDGDGDLIFDVSALDALRQSTGEDSPGRAAVKKEDVLVNPAPVLASEEPIMIPMVEELKELLGDPSKRIKLDDFVSRRVREFLDATDLRHFPVTSSAPTNDEVILRMQHYDELSHDLLQIVVLLATWGEGKQLQLLQKVFSSIADADKGSSGRTVWLKLTWYPVVLFLYSAAIAALAAGNYEALVAVFLAPVATGRHHGDEFQPLVVAGADAAIDLTECIKLIPGHERQYVPVSEYMFTALQPTLEDLLLVGRRYETLFDTFEILMAVQYADLTEERGWTPLGRFAWKYRNRDGGGPWKAVMDDADRERDAWGPLRAGLFRRSVETFTKDAAVVSAHMAKMPWF